MKAFVSQFNFPTLIRYGYGAVRELSDHLKTEGFRNPLIITEPATAALDFFSELRRDFCLRNQTPEIFCLTGPHLQASMIQEGADLFNRSNCDCIVAVGGRRVMSAARGVTLLARHTGKIDLFDEVHGGEKNITHPLPHLVTIPVAASGSELWRHSELQDEQTLKKSELFSPRLMAKVVFADPSATMELPGLKIREWRMEIMMTLLEAWMAIMNHPVCDGIAAEGLALLFEDYNETDNRDPTSLHKNLVVTSLMAGISVQKGSGLLRALSEAVADYSGNSQGAACSVLFPILMDFNVEYGMEKLQRLGLRLGWEERTEYAISRKLVNWTQTLTLPSRLSELGIHRADLESITEIALNGRGYITGPKLTTSSEIRSMLESAL